MGYVEAIMMILTMKFREIYLMNCFLVYFIDGDNDDEILSNKSEYGVLLRCICYFLAYWQRLFNMADNALYFLLKFLSVFFKVLFKIVGNEASVESSKVFTTNVPRTLYTLRKILVISKKSFKKFFVRSKCHFTYDLDDCIESFGGVKSLKNFHL